jgi:hypothetical protein
MESIFDTSIFTVNISERFGKEYVPMFEEMARLVTIQLIIQIMLFTIDNKSFPMITAEFVMLVLFICTGVLFYWLVLKRLIRFK